MSDMQNDDQEQGRPVRFIDIENGAAFKRGIFNCIIAPRPIAWIGTYDRNGKPNLAPYSYCSLISSLPPIVSFSCNTPEDRPLKDTLTNVMATRQFTFNMATLDLVEQVNATSTPLPHGVDEFEHAGLRRGECTKIRAPRVLDSPVSLECVVDRIERFGERPGEIVSHVTFGRVVAMHVYEEYLDKDGYFLTERAQPVARLGGKKYAVSATPFELDRPFRRAREESY